MKRSPIKLLAILPVAAAFLAAAGCSSHSNLTFYDRSEIESKPIRLPRGYNSDNYGRLKMGLAFPKTDSNAFPSSEMDYFTLRMQSELSKLKRFSILALHGTDDTMLRELEDLGEIRMESPKDGAPKMDLQVNLNVKLEVSSDRDGSSTDFAFNCAINLTCKDLRTGEVKIAKDLNFSVVRSQERDRYGRVVEGFDFSSKSNVRALLQKIATQAAIRIANELGNEYPVGGEIIGALGLDMLTLDRGVEDGIEQDMQMVVYTMYEGVPITLANADATPSTNTSLLETWRVNTDNSYAKKIVRQIKDDPEWVKKNKLYAVGFGMAYPPEWQTKEFLVDDE